MNKLLTKIKKIFTLIHTYIHTYIQGLCQKFREEVCLLFKPISFLYTSCKGGYCLGGGLYG